MVMVRAFERQIAQNEPGSDALGRAMVVVATMIGSLAVARGAAKGNPAVSEQLLLAARRQLEELMLTPEPVRVDERPAA
jgi:TetR/AcrR family transcriptional repressor of nem operon